MAVRETPAGTAQIPGPQAALMMTLSAFAPIDAAQLDDQTTIGELRQAIHDDLTQGLGAAGTNWSPVWVGISEPDGANMAYIAQNNAASNQYAVVIRGTAVPLDVLEDMNVGTTQIFQVGNSTVHIATGTAKAHGLVIGAEGDDGNTLLQELQSRVGAAGEGSTIFVTGHSLGGALATTVALYLQSKLQLATFQVYTFAAPSAGLTDFAALFDGTFPNSSPAPTPHGASTTPGTRSRKRGRTARSRQSLTGIRLPLGQYKTPRTRSTSRMCSAGRRTCRTSSRGRIRARSMRWYGRRPSSTRGRRQRQLLPSCKR